MHNVSDVRQIEVHRTEPLVPGPSHLEVEIAIGDRQCGFRRNRSTTDQIFLVRQILEKKSRMRQYIRYP
jgi:hypothetical protein